MPVLRTGFRVSLWDMSLIYSIKKYLLRACYELITIVDAGLIGVNITDKVPAPLELNFRYYCSTSVSLAPRVEQL